MVAYPGCPEKMFVKRVLHLMCIKFTAADVLSFINDANIYCLDF